MAPVTMTVLPTAADLDVIQNRVAVALAKRERLIKSWTASSSRPRPPPKSQQELDAEDADLFSPSPAGLGLGAPVPKDLLDGDVRRREISSNDKIRRMMLGSKGGFQASKPRDVRERPADAKRKLGEESSDEDQGRSAVGKAKKSMDRNDLDMKNLPHKDAGNRTELKEIVESVSNNPLLEDSIYGMRSEAGSHIGPHKRTETVHDASSPQPANSQLWGKKKPLVDYVSDDESDQWCSQQIITTSQQQEGPKSSASFISNHSTYAPTNVAQNCIEQSKCDTVKEHRSNITQTSEHISGRQNTIKLKTNSSNVGPNYTKKLSSKSGSSHSSKSHASSTESDPSDMETLIPLSLTSDVIARTSISKAESTVSILEAKRKKRRDKRARRRERDQQRKSSSLDITSHRTEKLVTASSNSAQKYSNASAIEAKKPVASLGIALEKTALASGDVIGVTKKIKDRLLDANGK